MRHKMRMSVTDGHRHSSREEPGAVGLISQGRCVLFGSAGRGGSPRIFLPLESVRSLVVSRNTAHRGQCSEPLTRGQQAGRGQGHAEKTVPGTCWDRGSSGQGRQTVQAPPLIASLPVSARTRLPQGRPSPLQGGAFNSPRATDGDPGHPSGWVSAFPEPAPHSRGLWAPATAAV